MCTLQEDWRVKQAYLVVSMREFSIHTYNVTALSGTAHTVRFYVIHTRSAKNARNIELFVLAHQQRIPYKGLVTKLCEVVWYAEKLQTSCNTISRCIAEEFGEFLHKSLELLMCRVEESDIGCHLSLCPNFAHGVCGDLATDLVPVCGKRCVNFQLVSVCPSWLPNYIAMYVPTILALELL